MFDPRCKLKEAGELAAIVNEARRTGRRAVFTNGCFDLLHMGHVTYLARARALGDYLIVALNSDASVTKLKGPLRPLVPQQERAALLAALECVDYVCIFDEDQPLSLLEDIRPEVYVKGGDYRLEQIPERQVVEKYGGRVVLLPYIEGRSTTGLVQRIIERYGPDSGASGPTVAKIFVRDELSTKLAAALEDAVSESRSIYKDLLSAPLVECIITFASKVAAALAAGKKLLAFGNGGSAADAQHLVAELVGRFALERKALPAIALTTDVPVISAVANDYDYGEVFARQLQALVWPGDIVVAISTSGNSKNVLRGLEEARRRGAYTVGLLGRDGGAAREKCDLPVVVPGSSTARIQEAHALIIHVVCQAVEQHLFQGS